MRVTYNWLRDYVDLDLAPEDLAERLTLVGLEVEEIGDRYAYLDKVVAARVAAVEDHPRSKHLKVCRVETDREFFQVVCGAPNVAPGLLSPLALVGTQLAGGPVGEAEIRGVHSVGMLCSEAELMVGPHADGIMVLPETARPGQRLKDVLGLADWVFEVSVTPNRPDCLSVIGLAREVAGILGRKLKYPQIDLVEAEERIEDQTSVTILSPDHCPRYVARVIRGVKIGPSPFWMVDRLAGVGLRSINNVVDITNFVLMETGQPLHAFDMDRLDEMRIVVQTAKAGQRFVTLDGTERVLGPEMLLICDARQGVALAGIMGGLNSEIVPETTNVLLESAYFNPVSIRRTSKALGLSTEASFRFERGIDPDGCIFAADRAAALMASLADGKVSSGIIDAYPKVQPKVTVSFSPARCNAFLGTDFEPEDMVRTLEGLELKISGSGEDHLVVDVPSFRVDLTREVDLFEEVARLRGYDQVPATLPPVRAETQPPDPSLSLRSESRNILEGLGLSEVVNYSFIFEGFPDKLDLPSDDQRRRTVRIINPLSDEQSLMRTSMVPSLLETLRRNHAFKVEDVSIFEIGTAYFRRDDRELPDERLQVGGLMAGSRTGLSWHHQSRSVDFYDVKGVVEDLLESLKTAEPSFDRRDLPVYYDEAASARVSVQGRTLGWLGRLTPAVAQSFDLKTTPFIFELDLPALLEVRQAAPRFSPLPRYPSVERDIALVLDREIEAGQVIEYISDLGEEYLTAATLFDVYEGPQVGEGARSLAFRLTYRSGEKTLTDEEVNAVHQRITEKLLRTFSARLRT